MKTSVEAAARALKEEIHAPIGAVNTLAVHQKKGGDIIRVWIDPALFPLKNLPKRYKGFKVIPEKRPSFSTSY